MRTSLLVCLVLLCAACGDDDVIVRPDAGDDDGGLTMCRSDQDCSDGVFCNGIERCMIDVDDPSGDGCVAGTPPRCDDGLTCTSDTCSHLTNACRFVPIDADGDGHAAASCVTADGEALGDDCDDNDAQRFPGNPETCTSASEATDEDCDDRTFGLRDVDGDGAIDAACCNGDNCGDDCDDTRSDVSAGYPEICDLIDNDCDGEIDVRTIEADWYPDADGDGFGHDTDTPMRSCAPIAGRSLFNTDLDDTNPAINPAARELCDGVDNDCDGAIDENDVCVCGTPGSAPCECVSGTRDCYGGLIPRECIAGHWVTQNACRGRTPLCALGQCVCVGGGTACLDVVDRSPPFVIAAAPGPVRRVPRNAVVSILLSEPPAPASVNATTFMIRLDGAALAGSITIDGELLVLTPHAALPAGRVLSVVLDGITDEAGNALAESYGFDFLVVPQSHPRELIGDELLRNFYGPIELDTNASGEAILSASRAEVGGGILQREVFARSSDGQWRTLASPQGADVGSVGIGENGTFYAVTGTNIDQTDAFYRLPTGAGWTRQHVDSNTSQNALAMGGEESCVVTSVGTTLTFYVPSVSGGFTPTPRLIGGVASVLVADGNSARQYAALVAGGAPELVYWVAPSGTPINHNLDSIGAQSSQAALAMNASGRAVATWLEPRGRVGGGVLPPVLTQIVALADATGATAPIVLNQGQAHDTPDVIWLADGSALALRRDGTRLIAQPISAAGVAGTAFSLGEDLGGQRAGDFGAAPLGGGNAIVAWVHGASLASGGYSVVAARYRNGSFEASEVIADSNVAQALRVAPLPNDRALVVWDQGSTQGAAVVLQ